VGVESSEAESFWLHAAIEQGTTDRNLEHRKFYTETKMFFTVSVMEPWNRLPRGCRISFFGDIQDLPE